MIVDCYMKTILLLILYVITLNCYSQALPTREGKVFYEQVDTATGTKAELYQKAKLWFANAFKDSKSVIQVDDKDNGQIVGKGNFDVPYKYGVNTSAQCNFTVKIDVKDNKYRLQIYNINYQWAIAGNATMSIEELKTAYKGRYYEKIAPPTNEKVIALMQDCSKAMTAQKDDSF
jgi:hypothetical protein